MFGYHFCGNVSLPRALRARRDQGADIENDVIVHVLLNHGSCDCRCLVGPKILSAWCDVCHVSSVVRSVCDGGPSVRRNAERVI